MMTPIRIPYIEKSLGVLINTLEGFENEKCEYIAKVDVLTKSRGLLTNSPLCVWCCQSS